MKIYFSSIAAVLALIFSVSSIGFGQALVSSANSGTMSAAVLNERMRAAFGSYAATETSTPVELWKITYASLDVNNKKVTLSGLVALPVGGAPKGLVVYCHGTTVDRGISPSRFKGTGTFPETVEAITGFATGGYAVVLPDYLGLGDHKAAHPFPLSKINARAGMDAISAAREFLRQRNYSVAKQLYISGYSEGGGVAMALVQSLQSYKNDEFKVTSSAPMAGPYDLSNTMRKFMSTETGNQTGFITRLYLISYATNYMRVQKGQKLTQFYKPALANSIYLKYLGNPTDEGLIKQIGLTTVLMRSKNQLSNVLNPSFLKAMQNNDRSYPFLKLLAENDTYDWSPSSPMLLISLEGDAIVDPENTTVAMNAMRRRGVTNATLRRLVIQEPTLNHLTAVAPSISKARAFFDGGFDRVQGAR